MVAYAAAIEIIAWYTPNALLGEFFYASDSPILVEEDFNNLRGFSANKIGGIQFLREVMNCKKRFFGDFEVSP